MMPDFWDQVVADARARRWRERAKTHFWRFPPLPEKLERFGNAKWSQAFAAYLPKAQPTVVHDPWNRRRRTNVHNAKSNSKASPFASLYGISR
jgi:hypothetical protein